MQRQIGPLRAIALVSGAALTSVLVGCSAPTKSESPSSMQMNHISTQAEAEALKPGDSFAMVCSMCKYVVVHDVGHDKLHVDMLTAGQGHSCVDCGGSVSVVGTGEGEGKREVVKHVCTKCGADAMFVCATSPSAGSK